MPPNKQGDKTKSKSSTKKENKLRDVEVALLNIDAMIEREKTPNVVNFDSMDQNTSEVSEVASLTIGAQVDKNVITEEKSTDSLVASDALTDMSVSNTALLKSSDTGIEETIVNGDSDGILVPTIALSLLGNSSSAMKEESGGIRIIENENNQAVGTAESSAILELKMKKIKTVSYNYSGLSDSEQKKEFCRTCREIEELSPASSMQLQPK